MRTNTALRTKEEQDKHEEQYEKIVNLIPGLREFMQEKHPKADFMAVFQKVSSLLLTTRALTSHIPSQMQKYARNSRADSTSLLRGAVQDFIKIPGIEFERFRDNQKGDRGFDHDVVSRLLCPAAKVAEFDANPNK